MMISDPLQWGIPLVILFYCGLLVLEGKLSIGFFIVVYQYSTRFMESLGTVLQHVLGIAGKMAAVERIREVMRKASAEDGTERLTDPVHRVLFRNVSFGYGQQPVLERLNLSFSAGEKIAFVGASGGGKSTIASLLVRYYEPNAGQIEVDDKPLACIERATWMSRLTLVSQEPYLLPDTLRANLLFGLDDVPEDKLAEVCEAMQIHDYIRNLPNGYDTVIGERGVSLSGGQRQRVALARAVLRDTEILILDEATSALDLETERKVQANLDRLRRGKITVVIAHRLSTVRNADTIFVMERGIAAEQGTHDWLMQNGPVYQSLVSKQNESIV